jgi:hypothetical protein
MKKLFLFTCAILMIFSCTSIEDNNSGVPSKVAIKWRFKVNGVLYQWEGFSTYSSTSGQSSYLVAPSFSPVISFASPVNSSNTREVMFSITIPTERAGTFIMNDLVPGSNGMLLFINNNTYSTDQTLGQCEMKLNISQIATSAGRITKGTFSGSMRGIQSFSNNLVQITEGSFESVRL